MYKQVDPLPTLAPQNFDSQKFMRPDKEFAVSYNWALQSEMAYENLRQKIDELVGGGIRAVCIIPHPPEYKYSPSTMKPNYYLTEEYMQMFRFAVEYALSKGMAFWMYDEAECPSGGAGGYVCRKRPDLQERRLKMNSRTLMTDSAYEPSPETVAAFSAEGTRLFAGYTPKAEETICEYLAVYEGREDYPDLLNPETAEEFLKITHDAYYRAMPDLLGKEIFYFFTDEPAAHGVRWPHGMENIFFERYGYDLRDHLPALFNSETPSEDEQRVRMDYHDLCADLFAENYLGQLQSWCREHGMMSIGHLGGEDRSDGSRLHGFRHIMRSLRKFDVPGVDAIMQQITNRRPGMIQYVYDGKWFPIAANFFYPRFASSAAAQTGGRLAYTESCAVYGPGGTTGFEEMRYTIGFQLVRGINVVNIMSVNDTYDEDRMTHLGGGSKKEDPSFVHLHAILESIARQCYALRLGNAANEVGLYLSVRDQWASDTGCTDSARAFDEAGFRLEAVPCAFDVVDDDFFEGATLDDGALCMGLARYKTIVLPDSFRQMPVSSVDVLERFIAAGGKVVQVSETGEPAVPISGAVVVALDALGAEVSPTARLLSLQSEEKPVRENDPSIRVQKRTLTDGAALYYIFNESMGSQRFTLCFDETDPCYRLDAEDGEVYRLSGTPLVRVAGATEVDFSLCSGESTIVLFSAAAVESKPEKGCRLAENAAVTELTGFEAVPIMSLRLGDFPEVRHPAPTSQPIQLGDWRSAFGENFCGRVEYRTHFDAPEGWQKGEPLALSLGEVKHSCEVFLNGKPQGVLYAHPYRLMLDGAALRAANNQLSICVANTTADQHLSADLIDRYGGGLYYGTSIQFCEPMRGGGLIGPVTLSMVE